MAKKKKENGKPIGVDAEVFDGELVIEEPNQRQLCYFAADGNYGLATGLTIVDTTEWDAADEELIEQAFDSDRPTVARIISEWISSGRSDTYREYFERYGVEIPPVDK